MIKKEEQDAVISEYETLLETIDKLRNDVKKDLKTYKLLDEYFISHLKENFKVLQLLLKNDKINGYYEIVRSNFEISILLLFILENKDEILKKIAILEYLKISKVKNKIENATPKAIMELLKHKKINYPYNLEKIEKNFDELKNFKFQDNEINEKISQSFKAIEEKRKNLKTFEESKEFQDEIIKMNLLKINHPTFYQYFTPKKLRIDNKKTLRTNCGTILTSGAKYLIEEIIVSNKSIKAIKIKDNLKSMEIQYNDKLPIKISTSIKSIRDLCVFLGKVDSYDLIYGITSSIVHGEMLEFLKNPGFLESTTLASKVFTYEIIKKLSLYFLDENSQCEIDKILRKNLGANYKES